MTQPQLLPSAMPRFPPNVAIVSGYHWHFSEKDAFQAFSKFGVPKTVRVYEDPINGSSRGIFFVEFEKPFQLPVLAEGLTRQEGIDVKLYFLTHQVWDRSGRLPDLPGDFDFFGSRVVEGYGNQGYRVRGCCLGLANTVTPEGAEEVERIRKRLRDDI